MKDRETAALSLITLCLAGALIVLAAVHRRPGHIGVHHTTNEPNQFIIQPPPLVAVLEQPNLVCAVTRPWIKRDHSAFFDFSDSEWWSLTNSYHEKLTAASVLTFSQGAVVRVSTADFAKLKLTDAENMQTNLVWFYR